MRVAEAKEAAAEQRAELSAERICLQTNNRMNQDLDNLQLMFISANRQDLRDQLARAKEEIASLKEQLREQPQVPTRLSCKP